MKNLDLNSHDSIKPLSLPILQPFTVYCNQSHSQNSSQLDQDKCYLMEIEQLKRQNNFLKKKLAQFTKKQRLSLPAAPKKRASSSFGSVSRLEMEEKTQNYIVSFIDEVMKLLKNFNLQSNLQTQIQGQNKFFNDLITQKTEELNRRLKRLFLQPQQKQFRCLLQIFQGYYRETTEHKKLLQKKVEQLTSQAIEMGKKMAQSVKQRQKVRGSIKGSRIFNPPSQLYQSRQITQQCLKSSIIKSTCTDQIYQVGSMRMSLGKQKRIYNLF